MLARTKINSVHSSMVKGPSPLHASVERVQVLQVARIPALATSMRKPLKTTARVILHLVRDARSNWHATMIQQPQSMTVHATSLSCLNFGCTDANACNFDATADFDDGSCEYASCTGCQDPNACDFDAEATIAGTCDYDSCAGCTNPIADNYDSTATIDNGTCEIPGCTIPQACNFDSEATVNDGSCEFESCINAGCTDADACNYDPTALICLTVHVFSLAFHVMMEMT